jgi:3-keto-disaccharide hydrolase
LKPVGEWNSEEITARGRQVTVKLNGNTIVDANLDQVKDDAALKKHPGLARKSGHLGFLGHGARVEFRNIRVKRL